MMIAGRPGTPIIVATLLAWVLSASGCGLMMDDFKIVEQGGCGDGRVAAEGEQCDDGNTEGGDGCDSSCAIEGGWQCSGEPSACTETVEPPTCETSCDDLNPCTDDFCNDAGECAFSYNTEPCDDDDPCTSGDACSMGTCAGEAYTCDDENPCTDDACNGDGTCSYENNGGTCDDDDPCTSGDACSMGACAGEAYACDDDNPCTDDACNGDGTCSFDANSDTCNDDDPCTSDDVCSEGACAGEAYECDDDNICTDDRCNGDGTCSFDDNTQGCDDGDDCTVDDVCGGGECLSGALRDADGDGFVDAACSGGDDCDDADSEANPGGSEGPLTGTNCCDAIDNDCDGLTDVTDGDCEQCVRFVDAASTAVSPEGLHWQDAYATVQQGIDSAYDAATEAGGLCQVWVAEGVYYIYDSTPQDTVRLRGSVQVYGGFAGGESCFLQRSPAGRETTLEGHDPTLSSQVYHVVTGSDGALIDGFTITGGYANGSDPHDRGGGMLNLSASPAVNNCVFAGNSAVYGGGMYNELSSPTVTGCTFSGNTATNGGGMYNTGSSPAVSDSSFMSNAAANGAGMYNTGASPSVVGCRFSGGRASYGGAIYNAASSAPRLLDDVFSANDAADYGGAIYSTDSPHRIDGCVFYGNRAGTNGGALQNSDSSMTVVGCTFAANQVGPSGGVIRNYTGTTGNEIVVLTLRNSILWNENESEISNCDILFYDPCTTTAYNSDVQEGVGGGSNTSNGGGTIVGSNPLFVRQPGAMRWTTVAGDTTSVVVSSGGDFALGDVIEIADDGVARTVTEINGNTVVFDIPLGANSTADTRVDIWGQGVSDVDADLGLQSGSPCIDEANDAHATCSDIEGRGRIDVAGVESDEGYADMGAYEYAGPSCANNHMFGGRIYWPGCDARDWAAAEALCVHFGGHLASVTSADENYFVRDLASAVAWIGASEVSSEGNWTWSDAAGWSYTNWHSSPGQPDDTAALSCAALYQASGTWYDEPCGDEHAFVCKK